MARYDNTTGTVSLLEQEENYSNSLCKSSLFIDLCHKEKGYTLFYYS